MPTLDVVVDCPIARSFRVEQMAGMFDVALEQKARQQFSAELPGDDADGPQRLFEFLLSPYDRLPNRNTLLSQAIHRVEYETRRGRRSAPPTPEPLEF